MHIDDMTFDGLVSGINPGLMVAKGTLKRLSAKATVKRGTLLGKGADGYLVALGSGVDSTGTFSATGDGTKTVFSLISGGNVPKTVDEVKVDGTALTSGWTYYPETGNLVFATAPENTKTIAVKFTVRPEKPYAILCDDTEVGTSAEVGALVYTSGCFDPAKCTQAENYTVTDEDNDAFRAYNIIFKAAQSK